MSIKFYTSLHYSQFCKRAAARQYVVPGGVDVIPDGTIVNAHERGFGVFDADGRFVAASAQMRGRRHQFVPSVPEKVPYLDMDVVYFGNVYPHFGHFLLEHMNRAWGVLRDEMRELPIVLVNNQNINPVPKYTYDLLDCLGIARDNIIILNETARFRNVYIPHQAFNIPFYWTDDFVKAYEYEIDGITCYQDDFNQAIIAMNNEVIQNRDNGTNYIYFILGIGELKNKVSPQGREVLTRLYNSISSLNNSKFILVDIYASFKNIQIEPWYQSTIDNSCGIWLGPEVGSQVAINITNLTMDDRKLNFEDMAFAVDSGKHVTIKHIVDMEVIHEE